MVTKCKKSDKVFVMSSLDQYSNNKRVKTKPLVFVLFVGVCILMGCTLFKKINHMELRLCWSSEELKTGYPFLLVGPKHLLKACKMQYELIKSAKLNKV